MRNFKKDYKRQFLADLNPQNDLEKIKRNLKFEETKKAPKMSNGGMAALIGGFTLAIASIIIIIVGVFARLDVDVPTYKGMDVVNYAEVTTKMANALPDPDDTTVEGIVEEEIPEIITDDEIKYFATKGETITICIRIHNPKQFEILSFVLDGIKYQSFQFKEKSTGEAIYIDFKVTDISGIQNIHIEELKYINNTEIKEAKYDGNQTIKVGIEYTEKPELINIVEEKNENSYKISFDLKDTNNLISSDAFYRAYLMENGQITNKISMNKDTKSLEFKNLKLNTNYKLYVYVGLDLLDSKGYSKVLMLKQTFKTEAGLKNEVLTVSETTISYQADLLNEGIIVKGAKLYLNGSQYKEVTGNQIEFNDVQADSDYRLEVYYSYTLDGVEITDTISHSFKTYRFGEPKFEGFVLYVDKVISLDLEFTDPNNLVKETNISIYGDGKLIKETTNLTDTVTLTELYQEIKVVVKANIDFKDGKPLVEREYTRTTTLE